MRNVIIGVPLHGAETLDFRFVDCLIRSVKFLPQFDLIPIFSTGDLCDARNRIAKLAVQDIPGISDLVYIDSDMCWDPGHLQSLLDYDLAGIHRAKNGATAIIGGTYRKRSDGAFVGVFDQGNGGKPDERGFLERRWVGTGFMRISKHDLTMLWGRARPYTDDGQQLRAVFKNTYDGQKVSEDVFACGNFIALGGKVFVDTTIQLGHMGMKIYTVDGSPNGTGKMAGSLFAASGGDDFYKVRGIKRL